jgi:PKHD-type hydroxylase
MSNVIIVKNFLSEVECLDVLESSLKNLKLIDAEIYVQNSLEVVTETRKSKICFVTDMGFINDRLKNVVKEKIKVKGFDTTNLYDFQFTKYELGGHFDWHVDSTNEIYPDRYYSCIVILNNNYEDGELEIIENNETITIEKSIGDLILFPSIYLHRVTPITNGERYTLVNWVMIDKTKPKLKSLI